METYKGFVESKKISHGVSFITWFIHPNDFLFVFFINIWGFGYLHCRKATSLFPTARHCEPLQEIANLLCKIIYERRLWH